jgi:hypothetical protein
MVFLLVGPVIKLKKEEDIIITLNLEKRVGHYPLARQLHTLSPQA